jgi:uncharacterized repeat protein (TIGR03806 family)
MKAAGFLLSLSFSIALISCKPKAVDTVMAEEDPGASDLSSLGKPRLSDYGFFTGTLRELEPAPGITPYTLNAPLFSDYAFKKRFVKIPTGSKAKYIAGDVFEFPEGTTLIKNFYYPEDFRKPEEKIRILETRLLIREKSLWKTLPYVWNEEQTDAFLEVAGNSKRVHWTHDDGALKNVNYSVPNTNQCKACHLRAEKISPIGLSARQLNRDYPYSTGKKNQLVYWSENNLLEGFPRKGILPRLTAYEDKQAPIDLRARAWLEVNCAHCHRPDGPARNSGLHLLADVTSPVEYGVGKAPVAAGKGTGGRLYSIVPGKPDESILQFRIESNDPGMMMPELGRSIRHEEGVRLVREWISGMKSP